MGIPTRGRRETQEAGGRKLARRPGELSQAHLRRPSPGTGRGGGGRDPRLLKKFRANPFPPEISFSAARVSREGALPRRHERRTARGAPSPAQSPPHAPTNDSS